MESKMETPKKINVLHDFFNHKSDASTLEATEQEQMENDFQEWFDEQMKDFEFAARFMMCHLSNYHPHHSVYTTNRICEISEGQESIVTDDYLCD